MRLCTTPKDSCEHVTIIEEARFVVGPFRRTRKRLRLSRKRVCRDSCAKSMAAKIWHTIAQHWETITQYFDKHAGIAGLIGGAVSALLIWMGRTAMNYAWGLCIKWRYKRIDKRVWGATTEGTNYLSAIAKFTSSSWPQTAASLRRLKDAGFPLLLIELDAEFPPGEEIWHRHKSNPVTAQPS